MPALPRTYFDSPAPAVDMTGWSEERKRFFALNGYDRGPATPETTVKVTETPPDDPTPTTRVTTTKYPEGMEQPGMQGLGLLGDLQGTTPDPLAMHQQAGQDFHQTDVLQPTDPSLRLSEQDDIAGSYDRPQIQHPFLPAYDDPITSRDEFNLAMEGRAPSGGMIIHRGDDGTPVTFDDLMLDLDPLWLVGGLGAAAKLPAIIRRAGGLRPFIEKNLGRLRDIARRKGAKPAAQAGSKIDYGIGFTDKQLARAGAQGRMLRNAETAALVGTGVAGGTAVGLLSQPEEEPPYYGYSPVLERGRGAPEDDSVAEQSNTTPELLVDQFEEVGGQPYTGGLMGDDPTWGSGELEDVAGQDAGEMKEELDRYYDYFPEDIDAKRDRYLKGLKEIYKKVAILNVIAALTNSPSQAGAFMQMAAAKFKTLEGFRGEERLQNIARGVFFTEDGQFDAPQSKQDAFNRAIRFGANHAEASALSGHKKEYQPAADPGYVTWNRMNPDTGKMEEDSFRKGVHPKDLGRGTGWSVGQGSAENYPMWYESMQLIDSIVGTQGRDAGIRAMVQFWSSNPFYAMMFGEQIQEQAAKHVDMLINGETPDPPREGQEGTRAQPSNLRKVS